MKGSANTLNSWSRDGRYLLTSSQDWKCILWDLQDGSRIRTVRFEAPVYIAELHPFNQYGLLLPCCATPRKLITPFPVSSLWPPSSKTNLFLLMSPATNLKSEFSPPHPSVLNPQTAKISIRQSPQNKQRKTQNTQHASRSLHHLETTLSEEHQKDGSTSSKLKPAKQSTPCVSATAW